MSVGQLIKDFGKNLLAELQTVFRVIASFVSTFFTTFDDIEGDILAIRDDVVTIQANIQLEISKLRNFKFDVRWKTRVINVPIAIAQIQDLIDEIFHQVIDRLKAIEVPIGTMLQTLKTVRTATGPAPGEQPSALTKVAASVAAIENGISHVRTALDAARDVSALFIDITERIQGLDDFFLQQGNSRIRLTEKASVRVGKLHANVS